MSKKKGPEIIIKGKPKKPKFVWEGKPKMTKAEEAKWWLKEQERWVEGYKGLKGLHYFYLTQIKIKTPRGQLIHPWWRDVDEWVIDEYYEATRLGQDLCIYKRRGIGLSVLFAPGVSIWKAMTEPGSTSLLTSNNKSKTEKLFNEKVAVAYENLDEWIRPEKKSQRLTGYLTVDIKDEKGLPTGNLSNVLARQTSDNRKDAANFESERATHAFIDELFLHDYASEVRQSIQSCLMDDFEKIAPVVFGGSAGIVSESGIKEAEMMWKEAESLNVRTVFIPGTMGISRAPEYDDKGQMTGRFYNFCPNGHSDKEGAAEWIKKRREHLDKSDDKRDYVGFVKSYPVEIDDIFEMNNVGIIPEDILPKINAQKKRIVAEPRPVNTYDLVDNGDRVIAVANSKGMFTILEHPVPGETYRAGTDPIPMVDTSDIDTKKALQSGKRSVHSTIVKRPTTQEYVSYYQRRTNDPITIYQETMLMQRYYNDCQNLVERNEGRVLMDQYRAFGTWSYLANQPIIMGSKSFDRKAVKGFHKDRWNRDTIYNFFFEYLRNHCDKIWLLDIINQLPDFHINNTDLLDALVSCELFDRDQIKKSEKRFSKPKFKEVSYVTTDEKGRRVTKWQKIPIFEGGELPGDQKGTGTLWQTRTHQEGQDR
jgi:hypothetical protein